MCIYKSFIHHPLHIIINQENAGAGILVPAYNRSHWKGSLLVGLLRACMCPSWSVWDVSNPDRRTVVLTSDRTGQDLSTGHSETPGWIPENLDKRRLQRPELRLDLRKSMSLRTKDYTCKKKIYVFSESVLYSPIPERLVRFWFSVCPLPSRGWVRLWALILIRHCVPLSSSLISGSQFPSL